MRLTYQFEAYLMLLFSCIHTVTCTLQSVVIRIAHVPYTVGGHFIIIYYVVCIKRDFKTSLSMVGYDRSNAHFRLQGNCTRVKVGNPVVV